MRKDISRRPHRRLVLMSHLRHRIDGAMRPRQNAHRADARTHAINQPASLCRNSKGFWMRKRRAESAEWQTEREKGRKTRREMLTYPRVSVYQSPYVHNFVRRRTASYFSPTFTTRNFFAYPCNFITFYWRSGKFPVKMRETPRHGAGVSRACH